MDLINCLLKTRRYEKREMNETAETVGKQASELLENAEDAYCEFSHILSSLLKAYSSICTYLSV